MEQSADSEDVQNPTQSGPTSIPRNEPSWILSEVVTEVKAVFVADCVPVSSHDQARQFVQYLIDNDKNVRSTSHNIMVTGEGPLLVDPATNEFSRFLSSIFTLNRL